MSQSTGLLGVKRNKLGKCAETGFGREGDILGAADSFESSVVEVKHKEFKAKCFTELSYYLFSICLFCSLFYFFLFVWTFYRFHFISFVDLLAITLCFLILVVALRFRVYTFNLSQSTISFLPDGTPLTFLVVWVFW